MCGIAGVFLGRSDRTVDPSVVHHMVRTLRHRGPDDEGFWIRGGTGLGMRRLKVVDPQGGIQPMANEDGSVRLVFNGEIYNHAELRPVLQSRGHVFRTRSDTEVIVHAYEEWGDTCFERFNGMFAIAIWDGRSRRLVLARDRLGIKPLYLYDGGPGVAFGSELKSVIGAPWVPVEWDLGAVEDFLTYEYVPGPRTILRHVRKIPPGAVVSFQSDGTASERFFWMPQPGESPLTPAAAAEGLRERLTSAVERRLMADVPLGAFLSGGVDSTVIVGIMQHMMKTPVKTFSIGFEDPTYNELPYARKVAQHHGTDHRDEELRPDIVTMAEELSDLFDEPFGDVSSFPTYLVSRHARAEVTVALSGDGGDELFAGYDHYRAHRMASRLGPAFSGGAGGALHAALAHVPPSKKKKGLTNKAKRFVEGAIRPSDLEHARWWVFWGAGERSRLFTPALATALADRDPYTFYRDRLGAGARAGFTGLNRRLYSDLTGYLVDDILVKVDRMSMGVSLEARVPYLDHEVVEYAMSIPGEWKLRGATSKWILKQAFADILPREIARRRKEGFSIPMKNWLMGPLQPLMRDLLSARRLQQRGWFNHAEVSRLIEEHLAQRANHAHRLWCLMALELSLQGIERRATLRNSVVPQELHG